MKRFIINILAIALLLLIGIIVVDIYLISFPHKGSYYTMERNTALAYQRLEALKDTNKMVIIGGSNGTFGINSEMLHEAFKMPIVNTATQASIGVRMQFEIYKELLRPGDIVIFIPEYHKELANLYGNAILLRVLTTHVPQAFKHVSLRQWLFLHKYIGIYYNEMKRSKYAVEFEGPYSYKSLNEYGDIACEREHQNSIETTYKCGEIDRALINYYQYVHTFAKQNDIQLVFLPPTLINREFVRFRKDIQAHAECLKRNGIPLQADPSRYTFPDSLYYDTSYHMTLEGAKLRTQKMIEDLHRVLKKS